AAELVLGHRAGHGDRALGEAGERGRRELGRRNAGLALAHEDAQAEVARLGAFELLDLAEALSVRKRVGLDVERVGGIGAERFCPLEEIGEEFERRRIRHGRCGAAEKQYWWSRAAWLEALSPRPVRCGSAGALRRARAAPRTARPTAAPRGWRRDRTRLARQ